MRRCDARRLTAPLYRRYCRVAVQRLETHAKASCTALPEAAEGKGEKGATEAARDAALRATEAAQARSREVEALLDEAKCNGFCLGDATADADAPWRLRAAVETLRLSEATGRYQVSAACRVTAISAHVAAHLDGSEDASAVPSLLHGRTVAARSPPFSTPKTPPIVAATLLLTALPTALRCRRSRLSPTNCVWSRKRSRRCGRRSRSC